MGESAISRLPEGCVAHALSLTSPRDACVAAAVSSIFHSAAGSDAVWGRFLPPDHRGILSRAVDEEVAFSSKKELFYRLCRPLLIDGGTKSFALDKPTGKKCLMLSAKELKIVWGDSPKYWGWSFHPESRFSEVAELLHVCWLEITGRLKVAELSPKTTYVAYFIFRLSLDSYGFDYISQEANVTIGAQISREFVSLQTPQRRRSGNRRRGIMRFDHFYPSNQALQVVKYFPRTRSDGWLELALGEFFNDDAIDDEIAISLLEVKGGQWKSGLIVEGIELRPKN